MPLALVVVGGQALHFWARYYRDRVPELRSEPGAVRFSEVWTDFASLSAHLRAPHIAPWLAAAREAGLWERQCMAYDVASEI